MQSGSGARRVPQYVVLRYYGATSPTCPYSMLKVFEQSGIRYLTGIPRYFGIHGIPHGIPDGNFEIHGYGTSMLPFLFYLNSPLCVTLIMSSIHRTEISMRRAGCRTMQLASITLARMRMLSSP